MLEKNCALIRQISFPQGICVPFKQESLGIDILLNFDTYLKA